MNINVVLFFRHRGGLLNNVCIKKTRANHMRQVSFLIIWVQTAKKTHTNIISNLYVFSQKNLKRITTNQLVVLTLQIVCSLDRQQHTPKTCISYCIWGSPYIHEYPLLIGVRSLPLLRSRCKNHPLHMPHNLLMFGFIIIFTRVLLQCALPIVCSHYSWWRHEVKMMP